MRYKILRQTLSKAYRIAVGLSFYLLDSVCFLFLPASTPRSKFVLVVRLDAIGDFVLWTSAAKELRTLYPSGEWRLILVANQAWYSLAEELGIFDEVWPIDLQPLCKNLVYRFRVLCRVRRAGFQIAIHPTYSREMLRGDALIRASGADQRIGSQGDFCRLEPWLKPLADLCYTRLVPAAAKPMTELERNAEFIAGLGGAAKLELPSLHFISSLLPSVLDGIPYFVLFPGASWTGRQWPATRFAELAARVGRQTGWTAVICGGGGDTAIAQRIQTSAGIPVINLAGKTDLKRLLAILAASRLVITNETSAAHIAPAVGTPTVCLLGGGHYGRFLPYSLTDDLPNMAVVNEPMECYGCNWRCIYLVAPGDAVPCVAQIGVEAVWQAVCKLLPTDSCDSSALDKRKFGGHEF